MSSDVIIVNTEPTIEEVWRLIHEVAEIKGWRIGYERPYDPYEIYRKTDPED